MNILKNKNYEFLQDILKMDSIKSIFISSWNCIYINSIDGYYKSDIHFKDKCTYSNLLEDIMDRFNRENKESLLIDDTMIYYHKWNSNECWLDLIRV